MESHDSFGAVATGSEIKMECFDGLVTMHYLDVALLDNTSQRGSQRQINGQSSLQPNDFDAGLPEIILQVAASGSHKGQIQVASSCVATNVEHHRLGTAAIQRIQNVKGFDQNSGTDFSLCLRDRESQTESLCHFKI